MDKMNTQTKEIQKQPTERGAASILIELEDGNIAVYHGMDSVKLAELENAPEGTWNKLWEYLEALGIERLYK